MGSPLDSKRGSDSWSYVPNAKRIYVANAKIKHDTLAKYVAQTRFPYVDQNTNPEVTKVHGFWPNDYVTIVNIDRKQRAIQFGNKTWYPDIVIVDGKNEVKEICEIEMEEDIEPGILEKWKGYAAAASIGRKGYPLLFLYVPASKLTEAKKIVDESKLKYARLGGYVVSDDLYALKLDVIVINEP
jgi:hypothetical protein